MIATITILSFLKCLGIVLGFLGGICGVMVAMYLWMEKVWPRIRRHIPQKVLDAGSAAFVILCLLLMFGLLFVVLPITICTAPGGPC